MIKLLISLLILVASSKASLAAIHTPANQALDLGVQNGVHLWQTGTRVESIEKKFRKHYYELVDANIKPSEDEFYVNSIYDVSNKIPKALVKRSTNQRSGEVFNSSVEFGVGDLLADDLIIDEIVVRPRKYIVVRRISTGEEFYLRVSYGLSKSRLIPKRD
jgi:hypothetical protein